MTSIQPGQKLFLCYVGDPLYHERLVLAHVHASTFIVATPDFDVFPEQLDRLNPDLDAFRLVPRGVDIPVGLEQQNLYRFRALSAQQEQQLMEEGLAMAAQERAALGLG